MHANRSNCTWREDFSKTGQFYDLGQISATARVGVFIAIPSKRPSIRTLVSISGLGGEGVGGWKGRLVIDYRFQSDIRGWDDNETVRKVNTRGVCGGEWKGRSPDGAPSAAQLPIISFSLSFIIIFWLFPFFLRRLLVMVRFEMAAMVIVTISLEQGLLNSGPWTCRKSEDITEPFPKLSHSFEIILFWYNQRLLHWFLFPSIVLKSELLKFGTTRLNFCFKKTTMVYNILIWD